MIAPPSPVVIAGTGSWVPPQVLTNDDLARMVETSDQWIRERTGIRERRIAGPGVGVSDMAYGAAQEALAAAGLTAADLDVIIVATMSPDMPIPSAACVLQSRLGAERAAAFDLNAACSGFLYGLNVAASLIRAGGARHVLLVGAEKLSAFTNWKDRTTCVLFGDGAGAVILRRGEQPGTGLLGCNLHADGAQTDILHVPAGGSRMPATPETVAQGLHYIQMRGKEVFKLAVRSMEEAASAVLAEAGHGPHDLDFVVPHQANERIITSLAAYLEVPMSKVLVNLDRYGNTSSASIAIALDEAVRTGRIQPGHLVLLVAFGAGLTWGAALIRWG